MEDLINRLIVEIKKEDNYNSLVKKSDGKATINCEIGGSYNYDVSTFYLDFPQHIIDKGIRSTQLIYKKHFDDVKIYYGLYMSDNILTSMIRSYLGKISGCVNKTLHYSLFRSEKNSDCYFKIISTFNYKNYMKMLSFFEEDLYIKMLENKLYMKISPKASIFNDCSIYTQS